MLPVVHLVRHGRIPDYQTDRPLTAEGEQEALAVGRKLAASVKPGETISFFSSPARRARQTAALLGDGLRQVLAEQQITATIVEPIIVDDRLENNRFYLDGVGYDPIYPLLEIARWRRHENPSPQREAAVTFQTEFWHAPDSVAYWLTQPSDLAESPEAVVERLQALLAERLVEDHSLRRDVFVTHSANLRAFLRLIFGHDPGSPPFSGMVTISDGQVHYQGQIGDFPF